MDLDKSSSMEDPKALRIVAMLPVGCAAAGAVTVGVSKSSLRSNRSFFTGLMFGNMVDGARRKARLDAEPCR
ncbi:hypothetical protein [Methylobacterium sp. J-067]|uniref:hypothetical protein n=1 Tax=Methylobacterium sp. J-067 TaxID=2836648 RepID=UPI001FB9CEE0|nr:hypothetical protein [Methylobacterium sp. J-067]MCJ2025820.1 hypothetical protein [Methylobacterium sp. J-067]